MRKVIGVLVIVFVLLMIANMFVGNSSNKVSNKVNTGSPIIACYQRGVAYYKEIGSYPTLSDGRSAELVVRDRCDRANTAF